MFKRILFLSVMLMVSLFATAQKASIIRMEVPAELEGDAFHLITLQRDGVLIFYESNEVNNLGQRKWYFALFNTLLKQEWIKFVPLTDQLSFVDSRQVGKQVYLLFKNSDRSKTNSGFYEIVTFSAKTGEFSKVSGSLPLLAQFAGFEVINSTACIALNLKKDETDLLFVNLTNGEIKPIHIESGNQSYIESLQADEKNGHFYAVVKYVKDKHYLTDELLRFTVDGLLESTLQVQSTSDFKMLRNFRIDVVNKNQVVAFGTYDVNTNRSVTFKDIQESEDTKSAGLFYLNFENGEQTALQFYDFLRFDNIYGSLKGREVTYNSSQSYDEKPTGNKDASIYYNLSDPQLFRLNDQYILTVEAYKYFYRTETRIEYDFYGTPVPYTYKVFDGYDFYDMIIVGFSLDGKLVWNNDFPLKNVKTNNLTRNTTVFKDEDFIIMAYVNDGKIITQTIDENVDIGSQEVLIESKASRERVTTDENTFLTHWYDDFFLVYGYQQVNNRSMGDQSIRTVFFANKVAFQ